MSNVKMPLNDWLLTKVINHLVEKEGCTFIESEPTHKGQMAILQDAFGFQYQLEIKSLTRINNDPEDLDIYAATKKSNFLSTHTKLSK